jgi:hypothetical protein
MVKSLFNIEHPKKKKFINDGKWKAVAPEEYAQWLQLFLVSVWAFFRAPMREFPQK